jgi:glycosyltransferase involved in cell wall biosynthesis
MKGIPLILHCHASVPDSIGNSRIGNAVLRRCLKHASEVLVLNDQSESYCNQLGGIACNIMPNFIHEDEISDVKTTRSEILNVVFVGHIIKTKGVIEVFEVAKRFPGISFIMAGILTSDIVDIIIPPNIALIGNVGKAKLKDILDCADIFLFPTHTEGFSMALLEAMASGLPIITTSVGANEEMLENQGGILASVGAVDEMCSALKKLQCPILRKQMSVWNISKVRNSYSAPTVIGRLKYLYNSLL